MNALNHDKIVGPEFDRTASGYKCPSPVIYEHQGEVWRRDCGHCLRCVAAKKKDTAGRAAAEAIMSAEIAVWTLSYADPIEPTAKMTPEHREMVSRVREDLRRKARKKLNAPKSFDVLSLDEVRTWRERIDAEAGIGGRHPGSSDFQTKDRQDFLKRVRDYFWQKARREVGAPRCLHKVTQVGKSYFHHQDAHVKAYWLHRINEAVVKVRYLGCGERGEKRTKRVHWHIILFLSHPSGWRSTPPEPPSARHPKGRRGHEIHPLWSDGFVTIDVLPSENVYRTENHRQIIDVPKAEMSAKMKAVRYCTAYLHKTKVPKIDGLRRAEKAEAKFFRSNATPLGYEFLTDLARQYAQSGLPINGTYRVPGVVYSRPKAKRVNDIAGRKIGERSSSLTVHRLTGRMRDHFIAAYREEWNRTRPDRPIPMTPWIMRYDSEADQEIGFGRRQGEAFKPRGRTAAIIPKIPDQTFGHAAWIRVQRWAGPKKGEEVGVIDIHPDGEADFLDADGVAHPIENDLRDVVPDLSDAQHRFLASELARHRGPGWISQRVRRRLEHEIGTAQVDAMRGWAKRGLNPMPPHLPPMEPVTGMFRKLSMIGYGGVAGVVSCEAIQGGTRAPAFIADGKLRLRKPVHSREV